MFHPSLGCFADLIWNMEITQLVQCVTVRVSHKVRGKGYSLGNRHAIAIY